ncbi:MAG: tRNA dihydrouridine synthase DusB [Clostridiales bacterium]|nr:tRNA dihydrouridine synthase DusB [Clostridiales bacterium]
MKIGGVKISGSALLAPMAGVTDMPFRNICKKYGAAALYTEMISAKGLYYKDKKTKQLMEISKNEHPCGVQIFGSDPDIMAQIVPEVLQSGCDFIDINMGCPTPKIVNNGDGSALMKNPKLIGEIVKKVSAASCVPVTVKLRAGWDRAHINAVEAALAAQENGAAAVAVHGRTREDFYRGSADWDLIRRVKDALKIPVIGNGDIFTAHDAKRMLELTGCDAVMVGRGAQGNPFIFTQINELLMHGEILTEPTPKDRLNQALEHISMLVERKGESIGIKESRKHIAWYIKGLPMASKLKSEVFKISDYATMEKVLTDYIIQVL